MSNMGEWVYQMGEKSGYEKGSAEGGERAMRSSIENIMCTLNLTLEQAMDALCIDEAERPKYASLIGA